MTTKIPLTSIEQAIKRASGRCYAGDAWIKHEDRVRCFVGWLTVDIAHMLLATQVDQPNVRKKNRERLRQEKSDLKSSKWDDGSSIVIDRNGFLIDGEHRCLTVVDLNKPMPVVFIFGVETPKNIDNNQVRTYAQYLGGWRSEKYPQVLGACLKAIFLYENGTMLGIGNSGAGSNDQLDGVLKKHSGIRESISKCNSVRSICSPTPISFCHYMGDRIYGKDRYDLEDDFRDDWSHGIATGADLTKYDSRRFLRNIAIDRKARSVAHKSKMSLVGFMACCINAWNLYVQERDCPRVQSLYWIAVGKRRQPFPTFVEK